MTSQSVSSSDADAIHPPLTGWGHAWRFAVMVLVSIMTVVDSLPTREHWDVWRIAVELVCGPSAFALTMLRRRHPLAIAVVVLFLATFSTVAAGPAALTTMSLATRRVVWQLVLILVLNIVSYLVFIFVTLRDVEEPLWLTTTVGLVIIVGILGWGMYVGSRRELLWTLRQRAIRAEADRDLRAAKARSDERARIAREMHDVLAHRISQISMHAGALTFRNDLDADAVRAGVSQIQARSNEALADLRQVLGVLREADPETGVVASRPQPTYDDLPELVGAARSAGARIDFDDRVASRPVPTTLGRTLYRIVQEGITNAGKHAPGARLAVSVWGDDRSGLEVELRNPLAAGPPAAPGAGLGLVGLRERVELAGGRLRCGPEGTDFVVSASLPWSS